MKRLVIGLVAGALFGSIDVSVAGHDPMEEIATLRMKTSTLEMQVSTLELQISTVRSEISSLRSLVYSSMK